SQLGFGEACDCCKTNNRRTGAGATTDGSRSVESEPAKEPGFRNLAGAAADGSFGEGSAAEDLAAEALAAAMGLRPAVETGPSATVRPTGAESVGRFTSN